MVENRAEKRNIGLPENIRNAIQGYCAGAGVPADVVAFLCLREPFEYIRSTHPELTGQKLRKAVDQFEPGRLRKESTPQFGALLKLYADLSTYHRLGELPIPPNVEKRILKQIDNLLNISTIRAVILGELPSNRNISTAARHGLTGALDGYIRDIANNHQPAPATPEELKEAVLSLVQDGRRGSIV